MQRHQLMSQTGWTLGTIVLSTVCLADQPALQVKEEYRGQSNHVVVVESPGRFRVGVLRDWNYGLSQWYDLVNDPKATLDLTRHPTPWNTVNRARNDAEDTYYMTTHTRPPNVKDMGDQGRCSTNWLILEMRPCTVAMRVSGSPQTRSPPVGSWSKTQCAPFWKPSMSAEKSCLIFHSPRPMQFTAPVASGL